MLKILGAAIVVGFVGFVVSCLMESRYQRKARECVSAPLVPGYQAAAQKAELAMVISVVLDIFAMLGFVLVLAWRILAAIGRGLARLGGKRPSAASPAPPSAAPWAGQYDAIGSAPADAWYDRPLPRSEPDPRPAEA